jgi:hypothetical protein|tara:strand:- start:216 stop:395 length:180 start_codon:yes stop_codon:yes gene_type:complete
MINSTKEWDWMDKPSMKSKADALKIVTEWEKVKIYHEVEELNQKIKRLKLNLIVKVVDN